TLIYCVFSEQSIYGNGFLYVCKFCISSDINSCRYECKCDKRDACRWWNYLRIFILLYFVLDEFFFTITKKRIRLINDARHVKSPNSVDGLFRKYDYRLFSDCFWNGFGIGLFENYLVKSIFMCKFQIQ